MDIFSSETLKNLSELTRTLTTVLERLLDEHDEYRLQAHPFGLMGYLYGKILAKSIGPAQALNVKIERVRFFEAQSLHAVNPLFREQPPYYTTRFPQQYSRYILCEVSLRKVRWQPTRAYTLSYRYYKPDGSLLCNEGVILLFSWLENRYTHAGAPGVPGNWTPGVYTVQVLLNEMEVAKSTFTIESPPPPPLPPPSEVLEQPMVQFYASETGRFQTGSRWYTIRFPQQTTRWVICELTVRNMLYPPQDRTYNIQAQCYTAEGKQLWIDRRDWPITEQEQEPSQSWALQAEQWTVGVYRIEILINGEEFAWGVFAIE